MPPIFKKNNIPIPTPKRGWYKRWNGDWIVSIPSLTARPGDLWEIETKSGVVSTVRLKTQVEVLYKYQGSTWTYEKVDNTESKGTVDWYERFLAAISHIGIPDDILSAIKQVAEDEKRRQIEDDDLEF